MIFAAVNFHGSGSFVFMLLCLFRRSNRPEEVKAAEKGNMLTQLEAIVIFSEIMTISFGVTRWSAVIRNIDHRCQIHGFISRLQVSSYNLGARFASDLHVTSLRSDSEQVSGIDDTKVCRPASEPFKGAKFMAWTR